MRGHVGSNDDAWQDRIAVNFALLALTKSALGTLLVSHWMGCLWYITSYIEVLEPIASIILHGIARYDHHYPNHNPGPVCLLLIYKRPINKS